MYAVFPKRWRSAIRSTYNSGRIGQLTDRGQSMKGAIVLITGAASGMGQLAMQRALKRGQRVAAWDLNSDALARYADNDQVRISQIDVSDAEAVAQEVGALEEQWGPIDQVWSAAAIMPLGEALEQPVALQKKIMDINYGGLVNLAHATMPRMLGRGRGSFVSFASLAGWIPAIYIGAYNASKFATVAYTEVLHHETRGRGVRVVCVCPPAVNTPLLDQARDTVWPKLFNLVPPIPPEKVLDAIDHAVAADRFWVFPSFMTRVALIMRRWFPGLSWWVAHKVEQR